MKVYDGSIIYYRDEGPGKLGFLARRIAESDNILMLIKLADNNPVRAVICLAGLLNPALTAFHQCVTYHLIRRGNDHS